MPDVVNASDPGTPSDWPVTKLADILTPQSRRVEVAKETKYRRIGVRWYAQGPFIKDEVPGTEIKSRYAYVVREGDFVYNRLFAWKGSFGVIPRSMDGAIASGEFPLFTVDDTRVDPEFLWRRFFLPELWELIEHKSTGSARTSRLRFKESDFLELRVSLPSLSEQRAIAQTLRTVQAAKDLTSQVIASLERVKGSLMRHLFTYGPVRMQETDQVALTATDAGLYRADWPVATIADIAATAAGGTPSRQHKEYFGGGVPWVKSGELRDSRIDATEETLSREGLAASSAKVFRPGTLLVAMYGATAGRLGVLEIEAATNQAVCAIFPNSDLATSDYLYYALMYLRQDLLRARHGGAQPNVSQTLLRGFRVPLPPLPVQQVIASHLQMTDVRLADEKRRLSAIDAILTSALRSLVRGEIRLPMFGRRVSGDGR